MKKNWLLIGEIDCAQEWIEKVVVPSGDAIPEALLAGTECVLLDASSRDRAALWLKQIRRHRRPAVYLKPVIIVVPGNADVGIDLKEASDGQARISSVDSWNLERHRDNVDLINQKIRYIQGLDSAVDASPSVRLFRYMYTRDGSLTPERSLGSKQGFRYPLAESLVDDNNLELIRLLAKLETQDLLDGEFLDHAHLCPKCHCAFLNFRETCPDCHSPDLDHGDLIHHFRCAYIGPLADFQRDHKMVCPKCDREIRQIGVDYDRPSTVATCNHCGHVSQEPEVLTVCFECGNVATPDALESFVVKRYSLSALAKNIALSGFDGFLKNEIWSTMDLLPLDFFRRLVALETNRIKRYKVSNSCVVSLNLRNLGDIFLGGNVNYDDLFSEISKTIKSMLRNTDSISSANDTLFLALMPDTPASGAKIAVDRIIGHIASLVRINLHFEVNIAGNIWDIGSHKGGDLLDAVIASAEEGTSR